MKISGEFLSPLRGSLLLIGLGSHGSRRGLHSARPFGACELHSTCPSRGCGMLLARASLEVELDAELDGAEVISVSHTVLRNDAAKVQAVRAVAGIRATEERRVEGIERFGAELYLDVLVNAEGLVDRHVEDRGPGFPQVRQAEGRVGEGGRGTNGPRRVRAGLESSARQVGPLACAVQLSHTVVEKTRANPHFFLSGRGAR